MRDWRYVGSEKEENSDILTAFGFVAALTIILLVFLNNGGWEWVERILGW